MAAQNITIAGTTYSDVGTIEIPKAGGGTASYTEVSDTTAAASDVASGKYFYTSAGVKTEGTASGGGTNPADAYITSQNIKFNTNTIPDAFTAYYPKLTDCSSMFYDVTKTTQTSITVKSDTYVTSMAQMFNSRSINKDCVITLDFDMSRCTSYSSAFTPRVNNDTCAKTIIGNIDFSSVTANLTNAFTRNKDIENITFVPNTMAYNFSIPVAPNLTNASLVSVGNCLKSGAHTLTLHATAKANLSNIMGTVTNNGTYDVFTESASGTVTLLSFITSTKGWTVA